MTERYRVHIRTEHFAGTLRIVDDKAEAERLAATLVGFPVSGLAGVCGDSRVLESWIEIEQEAAGPPPCFWCNSITGGKTLGPEHLSWCVRYRRPAMPPVPDPLPSAADEVRRNKCLAQQSWCDWPLCAKACAP